MSAATEVKSPDTKTSEDGDGGGDIDFSSNPDSPLDSPTASASAAASNAEIDLVLSDASRLAKFVSDFRAQIASDLETALSLTPPSELARETKLYDRCVIRFLTARKFDVTKSIEMWRAAIKWRQDNKIDMLLNDAYPIGIVVKNQLNCHADHYFDKQGRPIYIERIGTLIPKLAMKGMTMESIMQYQLHTTEFRRKVLMTHASIRAGKPIDQVCSIVDLRGLGTKHMKQDIYKFVQQLSTVSQNYYPEFLGQLYVINAPTLFKVVWKLISPWLEERTRSKISINSDSALPLLSQAIDVALLPKILGGSCECPVPSTAIDAAKAAGKTDKSDLAKVSGCMSDRGSLSQKLWLELCEDGIEKWKSKSELNQAVYQLLHEVKSQEERDAKLKELQGKFATLLSTPERATSAAAIPDGASSAVASKK